MRTKVRIALLGALAESGETTVRLTVITAVVLSEESVRVTVAEYVLPGAMVAATPELTPKVRASGVVPLVGVTVSHWFEPLATL